MHFMTLTPVTHRCSFGHPGIKDEFGLRLGSSLLHLGCDQQAGFIIHAVVIPAVWLATIPTTSIEANRPQMTGISSTNPWGRRWTIQKVDVPMEEVTKTTKTMFKGAPCGAIWFWSPSFGWEKGGSYTYVKNKVKEAQQICWNGGQPVSSTIYKKRSLTAWATNCWPKWHDHQSIRKRTVYSPKDPQSTMAETQTNHKIIGAPGWCRKLPNLQSCDISPSVQPLGRWAKTWGPTSIPPLYWTILAASIWWNLGADL